ncbi:sulfurtransferase TusA family protein [Vibrio pectenicida]|uniref:Sulfurtransferase TusA family protein n=1 Tax=Vibrio pectenicida TaxID=62763 RepID=A0A3R9FPQ4_9VIBR|nr:sulfurtransferase TusA family protein [Vibrio pectenicida]NOH72133.1 sulfurtransferase TusA family protein [Vibrio pectenicida]RSD32886.1 sulfurtransferase TusA family protein [Vibrio pectenicida]
MKQNILDLRQERCPMALLLVKRHTKEMGAGQKAIIYVSGHDSLSDIKRFLLKQSFKWICEELDGYFRVQVIKGTLSNV